MPGTAARGRLPSAADWAGFTPRPLAFGPCTPTRWGANGPVEQLAARLHLTQEIPGSNPGGVTLRRAAAYVKHAQQGDDPPSAERPHHRSEEQHRPIRGNEGQYLAQNTAPRAALEAWVKGTYRIGLTGTTSPSGGEGPGSNPGFGASGPRIYGVMDTLSNAPTPFFHFNDCRFNPASPDADITLLPATHWTWQTGNRWVATAGESFESWLGGERADREVFETLMQSVITDIPTRGTLVYENAAGETVEVAAGDLVR